MTSWHGLKQDLHYLGRRLRENHFLSHAVRRGVTLGHCSICGRTLFYREGGHARDHYRCFRCLSIPRFRALIHVLESSFPHWRELAIHESSPGGPGSDKLAAECPRYVATQYFPQVPLGAMHEGTRCENLERQTFADEVFDVVVTQDVFEHVLHPQDAFAEIARTLKPGGAHVFTVPWYYWKPTLVRAQEREGRIEHLQPPDYHSNPIDPTGSLVVTEWGDDLLDVIFRSSGLTTTAIRIRDRRLGIDADFIEVFISSKRKLSDVSANGAHVPR
jgi:hypothetical protein